MQSFRRFVEALKFRYLLLFMISLSAVILFSFMYGNIKQETYELKPFQIAPNAIRSIKTVEDAEKTELERERAASEVAPVYQFSEDVVKNRQAIAISIFDLLVEAKKEQKNTGDKAEKPANTNELSIDEMKEKLMFLEEEESDFHLSDAAVENLLAEDVEVLLQVKELLVEAVGEQLMKPLRASDVATARYEIERKIRFSETVPSKIEQLIITIGRSLIVETETVNEELTATRIEEAKMAVEPIRILQGQVIVREGQVIDSEVYRQLELAGLLTDQSSTKPMLGLMIFVTLLFCVVYMHFRTWRENSKVKKKSLFITLTVFFLLVILMKLITLIEQEFDILVAFLFPTALASMLVKLLTNERLAMLTTVMTAATAGVMLQEGYAAIIQMEVALYIVFGGITSLYLLGNVGRRSSILRASVGVSVVNLLFLAFYLLMTQSSYTWSELIYYAIAAIVSGILSGALTIGLMPFFETVFHLLSDMRLIELSSPNHPLLKKVLTDTPGTYHHSVMVANLADTACEAIGANGLLARVGCYYHDVGKTVRPGHFIENQHAGKNPHDTLPPEESRDIIISHAEDGAKLLEKYKMPREIVDVARQHHGTSLLKYFVFKARELGEDVNEEDYRYPGPKPQTREIAIISIADSVEAAVRSMNAPTSEKIASLVRSIVNDKLSDGQFDECDLSMKELKEVERVICETLNGIFHNRIEYPE